MTTTMGVIGSEFLIADMTTSIPLDGMCSSTKCHHKHYEGFTVRPSPLQSETIEFQGKSRVFSGQKNPLDRSESTEDKVKIVRSAGLKRPSDPALNVL